jgi:hypothetical protein
MVSEVTPGMTTKADGPPTREDIQLLLEVLVGCKPRSAAHQDEFSSRGRLCEMRFHKRAILDG